MWPSSAYPLQDIITQQSSMSQNIVRDHEMGHGEDAADHYRSQPSQPVPAPNQQSQPSQGESNFGDSSGPIFSMYSKAAEEEDKKMADRWQKDADGILIFTGLFSAAVAALLAVTIPSLIPNSQDTSAFYLGNIYQLLADPDAAHAPVPSPIAKPRPFSPPKYAIWVNSLWFLSLVISLTCALLATSSHQWARRYIRVTQPARCSPEKRARMRAFFANGVEKMRIAQVVEGLPTLIHLSLFLFFAGLVVFLFNINHAVFGSVVWWIALFSIIYGLITVLPIIRHDSPYFSPLSLPTWFLYATISHFFFTVRFSVLSNRLVDYSAWQRLRALRDRYRGWILGGVEKAAEETASEQSSEIDARILRWTIDDLGDDDRMANFFEAIPGFFNSKLVDDSDLRSKLSDGHRLLERFWKALNGFFDRTLSSNSVIEYVKYTRLDIGMDAMDTISIPDETSIPKDILFRRWDQAPQNVAMGHVVERWCASRNRDVSQYAQCIATRILAAASVQERDDSWIDLATRVLGLSEDNVRYYIAHGNDSVSLAILISVARRHIHSNFYDWGLLLTLYELNIQNTLRELQHEFCTLWNLCVSEATRQPPDTFPVGILRLTRFFYIRLHQGTHAAPTHFSDSTQDFDHILYQPSSYPLCDIQDHRLGSTISESPAEIGETSQPLPTTSIAFPVPFIPTLRPVGGSRSSGVAVGPQELTSIAELLYPPEGNKRQDLVTPWIIPDINQISFTVPTSATPVLVEPLASYNASSPPTSKFSPHSSSTIATSRSSQNSPLPEEPLSLSTSLSGPLNTATLPRLRPRGLINKGNMCFANVALQLLVHCPQFWNKLRHTSRLIGPRDEPKGQQTDSARTVLVDATFRLLDEFVYKEKTSLTQRSLQLGKAREDEMRKEDNEMDPFIPTYVYDAMKEKRHFKSMLNGRQQDAEELFWAYLDALDEEIVALFTSISTHEPLASAVRGEGSQSDEGHWQTEVGKRDHITRSVKAPISCIFDGTFRTTVRMAGQPDEVTIDSWRSLQLDVQPDSVLTVQDALAFAQFGSSGPSTGEASQQVTVLFEALPPVLVLHLKRFSYDAVTGSVVKNSKFIQLFPELEIPLEFIAPGAGQPTWPARYTLYGVLYHHGKSADGGHYTVDVLHPNAHGDSGDVWLHIDDETVSRLRHEDVFGRDERMDDRCTYLLFYRRTASTQTR